MLEGNGGRAVEVTCVIPVYNERQCLETLVDEIESALTDMPHRILFVDDGSTDGSHGVLRRLHESRASVDVIRFRRNFGKTAALAAGFAEADSPYIATLDGDLQDVPAQFPRLMAKLQEGFDIVIGWKKERKDPWHKVLPSRVYNKLVSRMFGLYLHDINSGFKLYRAEAAKSVKLYGNLHRLIPVLVAGLGYTVAEVPVEHRPRRYGKSKYGFRRFLYGGLDLFALYFIRQYAEAPFHFFGKWGMASAGAGFVVLAAAIASLLWGAMALGFVLLALAAIYIGGGKFMIFLGIIAEMQVSNAPKTNAEKYIVEKMSR